MASLDWSAVKLAIAISTFEELRMALVLLLPHLVFRVVAPIHNREIANPQDQCGVLGGFVELFPERRE